MDVRANAMSEVRVIEAPKGGRLLSMRPNRITYQAAARPAPEVFALAEKVKNHHGEGWINIAVEVVPR